MVREYSFIIPLHIVVSKKTDKRVLLTLNKVIGINSFLWNKIKKNISNYIIDTSPKIHLPIYGEYETICIYHWRNKKSDLSNISPVIMKIFLDVMQDMDIVKEDNIQFHVKNTDIVGDRVSEPALKIIIREVKNE